MRDVCENVQQQLRETPLQVQQTLQWTGGGGGVIYVTVCAHVLGVTVGDKPQKCDNCFLLKCDKFY